MKLIVKAIISKINTRLCLRNVKHGIGCKCNHKCSFTNFTEIGTNCHFNGMKISGQGRVVIGNNFHSGKNIRVLTTFHNFENGDALPYDNTSYSRDVIIGDNVWIGENVMILGGVTIGEGAIIQAGSVVCVDVPELSISGGHPAIPFKYRNEERYWRLKEEKKFT